MAPKNAKAEELPSVILKTLKKLYPQAETALAYASAWELLVATVLAAQCTDARVNTITPQLFARWPGPAELRKASLAELENVIHSAGFFHNKAKNLLACAEAVCAKYDGKLPRSMAELVQLPGVARKTANVILYGAWGINEGIAVDTHVKRISFRLGLTRNTEPVRIERDLMALFPAQEWGALNQRMVLFGRDTCQARTPSCESCALAHVCPRLEPPNAARKDRQERI